MTGKMMADIKPIVDKGESQVFKKITIGFGLFIMAAVAILGIFGIYKLIF